MFLQQVINGLATGSIYAMVALGYTMIYGILGLINFAQGEIYMAGAFTAVLLISRLNVPFVFAFILALVVSSIVGVLMERFAFRPLRNSNPLIPLIAAIGISLSLQSLARILFGPNNRPFPIEFDYTIVHILGARIPVLDIVILASSGVLMVALTVFTRRSKYGKAMVASAVDSDTARLMGINVNSMVTLTFIIGSVLSGAAGVMTAVYYNATYPTMGMLTGLKAFSAAILGGVGSIPGAILGGLVLGVAENLGAAYVSSGLKDAIAFAIMIIVLIMRPSGILGKGK
ncbi:MAG: branched-chain amino acid ABC transporter permease [Candidatus Dadabacteria bacterium]|nr:branched-chain amino acid ABC transporter permease [Candidatus Dadabacteria bacterium]